MKHRPFVDSDESTKSKEYWLSFRDKSDEPEYRVLQQSEFPSPPQTAGMDRRSFLTIMGASVALAGLTSCRRPEEHIVPYVSRPEEITPGNSLSYATSMPLGTESEALMVEAREGRPYKVAGNPLRSATGSASGVWANASILGLYDPDRSMHARRAGETSTVPAFTEAWKAQRETFLKNGGEGLGLLLSPFASPTLWRLVGEFRNAYPNARLACYDPVSDRNILDGSAAAFASPLRPVYDFAKADVVLALDADCFGTERDAFAHARAFASKRKLNGATDGMNRLYLVESSLTQTSAMADHRLRLPAGRVPAFLAALVHNLASKGLVISGEVRAKLPTPSVDNAWVTAVADDLLAHKGAGLIVAGRGQSKAVHAMTALLNHALGNAGASVSYLTQPFAMESEPSQLRDFVTAMRDSKLQALIMLGGNSAFTMPADLEFRNALENVGLSAHLSLHVDETSASSTWHLPARHYMESWGDVSGTDGRLGVVQPLIAPLYEDGLSDAELLHLLISGELVKGADLVNATWKSLIPGMNKRTWRGILHDGVYPWQVTSSAPAPNASGVAGIIDGRHFDAAAPRRDAMEVVFRLSPTVHDGRFANNAWLQEFPDPVTKLTWDNAALISRSNAKELGLKDGDLVRLSLYGRETPMPVWIVPGQADWSVTVLLGYGRRRAGRVGSGVGFNAYRLRTTGAMYLAQGLTLGAKFGTHALACVQDHHGLDEERMAREGVQERLPQIFREATLDEFREHPDFANEVVHMPKLRSMWNDHRYETGMQWGMSIDLNACIGCGACTIACQSENNIPVVGKEQVLNGREMHWIRIDRYYKGEEDDPGVRVMPLACHHCEMAPCEQVCPVAATSHDEEGLNVMTYNRCIGTRYCSNNCPYKARRFNFLNYTGNLPEVMKMAQNPDVSVRFRGVMEKCTYCTQRIERVKIHAKVEGREVQDGDIRSACQEACPTRAIVFGDINDRNSAVAKEKESPRSYQLLGEFNLRPRTTFLAKVSNPNPVLRGKGSV
jgi:MoCo/4Fe-4S cofactor protein with predicted Tat translocation signal